MGSSETLRAVIDTGGATKRLDELSTARVIGKIAEQLHAAQQKAGAGKPIGPITPASISIEATGAAKLGLAEPGATAYSAPEQLGATGDRRSDVFSLGVVMWEALTHQRLFDGVDEAAIKSAVETRAVTPPSELNANIPAELGAICMKALARAAADRYQSAKVMAAEIEAVLEEAGYADTDDKIAEYMATFGQAPRPARSTLPPLGTVTPAIGVPPPPVAVVPEHAPSDTLPMKAPSILDKPPTQPPPMMVAASPGSLSPMSFAKPATTPPPVTSGATLAAALAAATAPPPAKPAATILSDSELDASTTIPIAVVPPPPTLPTASSAPTVHGFAAAASFAAATTTVEPPPPMLSTTAVETKADGPNGLAKPDAKVDAPKPDAKVDAPKPEPAAIPKSSTPHPASVVALPAPGAKAGRESQEVLGGWGWGTDSHPALQQYEDADDVITPPSRKPLLYMIGGGLGLMLVVIIIAVGFGGSSSKKPQPPPTAAVTEGSAAAVVTPPAPPPPPSPVVAAGSDTAGSDMAGSAAGSAMSGSAVASGSGTGSSAPIAAVVTPDVPKPDVPKPAPTPDVPKPVVPKPVAKIEPVKPVTPAPKPEPTKVAKVEPQKPKVDKPRIEPTKEPTKAPAPSNDTKPNVETAYRMGLQQFARGDTSGALASLRTSLAGNPNYPPTWRGLGLVFEKMGERDQARAAFKRYLQLAPNAGDADQIRNRLERLGT